MADQPPHLVLARTVETLAGQLHALAFVIIEEGTTGAVRAEAYAIADAVLLVARG